MRPPTQNALIVEREPVLVAQGAGCGDSTTRLPVVDLIYPYRFAGWSRLRKGGRSKALPDLLLCRMTLTMGEETSFVGLEKDAPADGQRKDNDKREWQLHAYRAASGERRTANVTQNYRPASTLRSDLD